MKKLVVTLVAILVLGVVAVAQSTSDDASKASSSQTTVQGCLSHSGSGYTLTDKSGNTYQLTGNTSKLTEHIGHEVEIRGTTSGTSEPSGAASSETAGAKSATGQQIEVSSVKHISETCTSSSNSGAEKSPSDKSPMNEKPPMSEKPQGPPPPTR